MKTNGKTLKFAAIVVGTALLASWTVTLSRAAVEAQTPKLSPHEIDRDLRRLVEARYESARKLLAIEEHRLKEGGSSLTSVCEASRRVGDAALELTHNPEAQLAALTNHLAVARRLEESVNRAAENGAATSSDTELARYWRLDAEIALLRAKRH
jgi:hypothetical protein